MRDVRPLLFLLVLGLSACATPPPAECPCKKAPPQEHTDAPTEPHDAHAHGPNDQAHAHHHAVAGPPGVPSREPVVVPHAGLRTFENSGNALVGVATPSLGAREVEVWRSSIAVGSRTPVHTHASEEVFIVLSGSGVVHVGEQALAFEAPATVIAPAGVAHWVENTGSVPTDQIVVVRPGSEIAGADGRVMALPWRK